MIAVLSIMLPEVGSKTAANTGTACHAVSQTQIDHKHTDHRNPSKPESE
jgi:hypothetical protein